jgi:hypothetical protein
VYLKMLAFMLASLLSLPIAAQLLEDQFGRQVDVGAAAGRRSGEARRA